MAATGAIRANPHVGDEEIKGQLAAEHPYGEWVADGLIQLEDLPEREREVPTHASLVRRQQVINRSFALAEHRRGPARHVRRRPATARSPPRPRCWSACKRGAPPATRPPPGQTRAPWRPARLRASYPRT